MNKDNKTALYTSPEVEVIEIKARQVVCASLGSTSDDYPVDNDDIIF